MIRELKHLILSSFFLPNTASSATLLGATCKGSSDVHSYTCKLDILPILVSRRWTIIFIVYHVFNVFQDVQLLFKLLHSYTLLLQSSSGITKLRIMQTGGGNGRFRKLRCVFCYGYGYEAAHGLCNLIVHGTAKILLCIPSLFF